MKPFLSVPTRGAIHWATVTRLEEIRDGILGCPPILYQAGNLSVAQTRNRIVEQFMSTDRDVLVMVDDDVVPSPHWLETVLPFMDEWGLVCLPHVMPHPKDRSVLRLGVFDFTEEGEWAFRDRIEDGLNECDAVATGCIAISRPALVPLGENPFRIGVDAWGQSDDYWFCRDLHEAGYRVGYWWDGWYADHMATVSLAPLLEARMLERSAS